MKAPYQRGKRKDKEGVAGGGGNRCDAVRDLIAGSKKSVLLDYTLLAGEHARLLKLALNEAEALAWQTSHPHLFFPLLATEKAEAAVKWHKRQSAVRRGSTEVAFTE